MANAEQKYQPFRVIASGSFGMMFEARMQGSSETVAIKKVLQGRQQQNRELEILQMLQHPNIIIVIDAFISENSRTSDSYLNIVMELMPANLHEFIQKYASNNQCIPFTQIQIVMWQICRGLAYMHSKKVCHRDMKPQNIMIDPESLVTKITDFGCAKALQEDAPDATYICSRFYRAPELIFENKNYDIHIDTWSLGCILAEMFLGTPVFQGGSSIDQLVEIIKILGSPSREDLQAMNPSSKTQFNFPHVKTIPWKHMFADVSHNGMSMTAAAIDLVHSFLLWQPIQRLSPLKALNHEWFQNLSINTTLSNHRTVPESMFNFDEQEKEQMKNMPNVLSRATTNE